MRVIINHVRHTSAVPMPCAGPSHSLSVQYARSFASHEQRENKFFVRNKFARHLNEEQSGSHVYCHPGPLTPLLPPLHPPTPGSTWFCLSTTTTTIRKPSDALCYASGLDHPSLLTFLSSNSPREGGREKALFIRSAQGPVCHLQRWLLARDSTAPASSDKYPTQVRLMKELNEA